MKILIAIPRAEASCPLSRMHTHKCVYVRARITALRVRKVRRVTRRANDDDTLISPGGRGSFFKGQQGGKSDPGELLNEGDETRSWRMKGRKSCRRRRREDDDDDDNDDDEVPSAC